MEQFYNYLRNNGIQVILNPIILGTQNIRTNNNNHEIDRSISVQDHIEYSGFFSFSVVYSQIVSSLFMRLFECILLILGVVSFFMLVISHLNYSQMPANCLDHIKDAWPKDGILRIEIIHDYQRTYAEQSGKLNDLFTLEESYKREFELLKSTSLSDQIYSLFLDSITKRNNFQNKTVDIEQLSVKFFGKKHDKSNFNPFLYFSSFTRNANKKGAAKIGKASCTSRSNDYSHKTTEEKESKTYTTFTPFLNIHNKNLLFNTYIVEYSLEYGFLHLPPNTRKQLGVPVMFVPLEPNRDKCFGDERNQYFLKHFFGYDNILKLSLLSIVKELNDGFMRNVIKDTYYNFSDMWEVKIPYIVAFSVMFLRSTVASVILRSFQRQLFNYSTANPYRTVVLVWYLWFFGVFFIGMASLSFSHNFFNGFVSLIVMAIAMIADMFNSVSRSAITRKFWPRFFYLYHFILYAYCGHFNDRNKIFVYSCTFFLTFHAMVYFYHHYELPIVVSILQVQLDIQARRRLQNIPGHGPTNVRHPIRGRQLNSRLSSSVSNARISNANAHRRRTLSL